MTLAHLAYHAARIHKWLGLIVGIQLFIWTATGLFFTAFAIADIRGDALYVPASRSVVDLSRVNITSTEALAEVAEDSPNSVTLRNLGDEPVYEVRADIGMFLVSAETGDIRSPIVKETAEAIAKASWRGEGEFVSIEMLEKGPRESGRSGEVWAAHFEGKGNPILYVNASTGDAGPVRTDLWRTYDFLWGLHIMDYSERESFNHPLIIAAAILALTTVLFGIALVVHRFSRNVLRRRGS